jgi:HlyD family secretion protein
MPPNQKVQGKGGDTTRARLERRAADTSVAAPSSQVVDAHPDPTSATVDLSIDKDRDTPQADAEVTKLDAGGRIDYLRKVLYRTSDFSQSPPAVNRNAGVDLPRAKSANPWLYAPAQKTLRRVISATIERWEQLQERLHVSRLLKSALGLALVIGVGWGPAQRLMQTTSVEAVVNARLVTLRAPIDGEVAEAPGTLQVGANLASGATLLRIVNRRADRSRLDDLRRTLEGLREEQLVLNAKIATLRAKHAEFVEQTKSFQQGRIKQLEARAAEIDSEIAGADVKFEEAAELSQRMSALESKGVQTPVARDRARREQEVAVQAIAGAQQRARAVAVELEAARTGTFVGDSYNDRPRSSQQADELQEQLIGLTAELRLRDARAARLETELAEETARFNDLAEAKIVAPANASVWEVLTAPGEEVRRGQDLVRLLDCNTSVVTAAVSESVYNQLRVGARARFRFRDDNKNLEGRVVHLTGVAAAPANLAIAPSALMKEAYRVTVAIPGLAASPACDLGRTGRVIFEDGSPATATSDR